MATDNKRHFPRKEYRRIGTPPSRIPEMADETLPKAHVPRTKCYLLTVPL